MYDKRYPGFDVNPLRHEDEFELLGVETINKLCEAGFRTFREVQATSIDVLRMQAGLSNSESEEVKTMLKRCSQS